VAVATTPRANHKLKPGTIYGGRTPQWSFVFHRVTGLAVLGFLLLHILGESFIGMLPPRW
jgi:succinate dehydrogenase / fumarate reductase cytochrome b subunit